MGKKNPTLASGHSKQWLSPLLTLVFTIIYVYSLFVHAAIVHADAVPGGNIADPVVRAVDLAKPAVVRIITSLTGHITVHFPGTSKPTVTFPRSGSGYKLAFSGSGAFISAHGDILTADHVVNTTNDPSLDQYLQQLAAQDIADYINQNFDTTNSGVFSANDVIASLADNSLRSDTNYSQPSSEVYLSTDYTGFINAADLQTLPTGIHATVDKIERESPFTQKDLAIIHANLDNTPFIKLDDSTNVAQQDDLTIIGFPGNGDVSTKKEPNDMLTSSVNKIYVSALKKTDAGITVIQVGGNIEHGDSGGPALDRNGNIVGIVSFGLEESQPEGTTFLQGSKGVQDLLQTLTVDTKPGTFQKNWSQAFADYTSTAPGHWHAARADFKQLSQNFTNFQAVAPYLDYVTAQAAHEQLPQTTTSNHGDYTGLIIGIAIAFIGLVVLLGLFLIFFLLRKKKQPPVQLNTTAPTPPYAAAQAALYSTYAHPPTYEQTAPNNRPQVPIQQTAYAPGAPVPQRYAVSPTPVLPMPPLREYGQAPVQPAPPSVPAPQRYMNGQAPAQPTVWPQYPPPYYSSGSQPYPAPMAPLPIPPTYRQPDVPAASPATYLDKQAEVQPEQPQRSIQNDEMVIAAAPETQAGETDAAEPVKDVQEIEALHAEKTHSAQEGGRVYPNEPPIAQAVIPVYPTSFDLDATQIAPLADAPVEQIDFPIYPANTPTGYSQDEIDNTPTGKLVKVTANKQSEQLQGEE